MNKFSPVVKAKSLAYLVGDFGADIEDVVISGISDDTRCLVPGDAFLCLPRAKNIPELVLQAVQKGASAIIFVHVEACDAVVPCACLSDMQAAGLMLRRWFETEYVDIPCIGITGTDGKTSTAWMLREVLALKFGSAWSCGTLGLVRDTGHIMDMGNTTPSLLTLHALLAVAVAEDIGALILEVSSHGIAQERIAGLPLNAAIWTTMGRDHLEDHGGFDAYLACKSGFVRSVAAMGGQVVANADYLWIKQALEHCSGKIAWYAQDVKSCPEGAHADVTWSRHRHVAKFTTGHEEVALEHVPAAAFHAENLASIVLLMKEMFGYSLAQCADFDGAISTPIGRLEPVDKKQQVFIDYAHTAEGLSRCLQSARNLTREQLLLVFGCGGDRDKAKRPAMGAVAVKYANQCWLTSDNPRSEKQSAIVADVLHGMATDSIHIIENRERAIFQAVEALGKADVLVIAGKGHERYMEIQGERLPWSDKDVALRAIAYCEAQECS